MSKKYRFLCTGALAGLANGLFGAGGGLFLVPLLTRWCGLPERSSFATSVAVIFPLSILSVIVYYLNGALPVTDALPYLVGGAAGGLIAGRIFKNIRMVWLRRAFGALILYGGIRAVLLL